MITNVNNQHLYDEELISKIKEIIEKGFYKLKSFVKSKMAPKLDFYDELESEFNEISLNLEELALWEEQRYFLSIKEMVLYIIHRNSIEDHFGHCNFAVELLNFFVELFNTNAEFYRRDIQVVDERFLSHQETYKKKYHKYREIFYKNIYEFSENYAEEEIYEVLKSLNG